MHRDAGTIVLTCIDTHQENAQADDSAPTASTTTTNVDEAIDLLTNAYSAHRMVAADRHDFRLTFNMTNVESLLFGQIAFDADVLIAAPPTKSFYVFCYAQRGSILVSSGDDSTVITPSTGAMLSPTEPLRFERWNEQSTMTAIRIDRFAIETELGTILGRPAPGPIHFAHTMDLTTDRACDFMRALRLTQDEAVRPRGLAQHPVLAAQLARLVASSLILAQPHNFSDELSEPSRPTPDAAVGDVVDAIQADPMGVATAADVATLACLSLRALERRFARHVGVAPMAYVRRVRLERARTELQQCDPGTTTVTAIAHRWGFTHLGRFAAAYQERYGEPPSQTLQHR